MVSMTGLYFSCIEYNGMHILSPRHMLRLCVYLINCQIISQKLRPYSKVIESMVYELLNFYHFPLYELLLLQAN